MRIFTWNTQGNFYTNIEKREVVRELILGRRCEFGLLQESGVWDANGAYGFGELYFENIGNCMLYYGATPGAYNQRCTNAVLSRRLMPHWGPTEVVGGGLAGRTGACVGNHEGVSLISWHSIAAGAINNDTMQLVNECIRGLNAQNALYHTIIIGGDMNCAPEVLGDLIDRRFFYRRAEEYGEERRDVWNIGYRWIAPNSRTHIGGGILDYFLILHRATHQITFNSIVRVRALPSDHYPVVLDFDINER